MASRELAPNTCRGDGQEAATESVWRPIDHEPTFPCAVVLFYSGREWTNAAGTPVSFGAVRDNAERVEVGFWDGGAWCEAGTAHDCFEPWRVEDGDVPTHWMPLPEPPK